MSYHFQNRLALVTGAGSGIGRATALALGRQGARVVLCDRDTRALAETADCMASADAVAALEGVDVSDWQAMQGLAERVHDRLGPLDILVNNAGVGAAGDFLSTPIEDWHWVMGVNLMGVVHGCKAFGERMAEAGQGHIVNVASAAGFMAPPDMSAYAASKHAVMGLSESLRLEMAAHGIGVSVICPGVINTNIVANTRMHGQMAEAQGKLVKFYQRRNYGPERVAEAILDAIRHNRAVVPVSPEAWAMYAGKRLTPSLLDSVQRSALFRRLKP